MPLPKSFFDSLRGNIYKDGFTQTTIDTLTAIYMEGIKRGMSIAQIAYCMATPYHEVGPKLDPRTHELGFTAHSYGQRPGACADGTFSNIPPFNSLFYYGRGLPQLTWLNNYQKMAKRKGKPYDTQPEMLFDLDDSVWVLMEGMQYGIFTGHKLSDYITIGKIDWINARRIVNGTDKAELIAGYAQAFDRALMTISLPNPAPVPQPVAPPPVVQAKPGLLQRIATWFKT